LPEKTPPPDYDVIKDNSWRANMQEFFCKIFVYFFLRFLRGQYQLYFIAMGGLIDAGFGGYIRRRQGAATNITIRAGARFVAPALHLFFPEDSK
jgi:hypothetical protein